MDLCSLVRKTVDELPSSFVLLEENWSSLLLLLWFFDLKSEVDVGTTLSSKKPLS